MPTNIKILVACHKPFPVPQDSSYLPIHVGKALPSKELGFQGDDTGENISFKNPYYCELTALYWAWKNLKDVDIVGLCHYRRYFDFNGQCRLFVPDTFFPTASLDNLDFHLDSGIVEKIMDGSVVVPKALYCSETLKQQYCNGHYSKDFQTLLDVIEGQNNEKISNAFREVCLMGYIFRPYNMFVMRWNDFDAYCSWLFETLFEVEDRCDISTYSVYQQRIYGFMAERLLSVWLQANQKALIEKPIMVFDDKVKTSPTKRLYPRKALKYLRRFLYCKRINSLYRKTQYLWH